MSQTEVFILLKEAGGRARKKQLTEMARNKFPNVHLCDYISDRLTKLRTAGQVGYDANTHEYYIKDDYLLRHRNIVQ